MSADLGMPVVVGAPVDFEGDVSTATGLRSAVLDVAAGHGRREIWWTLAVREMRNRYRRTTLGPFWITLQVMAWILGIGLLYGALFGVPFEEHLKVVAGGMVVWTLISGLFTDSANVLISSAPIIKGAALPRSVFSFRMVTKQLLIFLHTVWAMVVVLLWTGTVPTVSALVAVPAVTALMLVNGFALSLWLGPLAARFRDVGPLVDMVIRMGMFLSPVWWSPAQLDAGQWMIICNPLAWFIEAFRAPLLGQSVPAWIWAAILSLTVFHVLVGLLALGRSANKIAYWV